MARQDAAQRRTPPTALSPRYREGGPGTDPLPVPGLMLEPGAPAWPANPADGEEVRR
jgi:hypothetical protein